jgi:predicted neutral ceramidase superfamily lipid hydrolase
MKMTVSWDIMSCTLIEIDQCYKMLALMMKAVHTSEILVNFYQTTLHNVPEDFILLRSCFLCYIESFAFEVYKTETVTQNSSNLKCHTYSSQITVWDTKLPLLLVTKWLQYELCNFKKLY